MVWKRFFGDKNGKKREEFDPLADLELENMKLGYLVDYDLKSWEVTARHTYDWGEGGASQEWELRAGDDLIYLERTADDDAEWCVMRKISFSALGAEGRKSIRDTEDPPESLTYDGTDYELEGDRAGYYHKNTFSLEDAKGEGLPVIVWDYLDESERGILTIEQWGESEFDAGVGIIVEEYEFTNVLPR